MTVILIALGGACGSVARYLSMALAGRFFGAHNLAFGTMAVNVLGSLLMGVAFVVLIERAGPSARAPLVMAGFLGGFTTFSAFSLDAFRLYEAGRVAAAAGYVAGSVFVSIAALIAGISIARAVFA